MTDNNKNEIDFTGIGKIIWENRKNIILSGIISLILGVVVSFLLPVYYKSSASVYPPLSTNFNDGLLNRFGEMEGAEQVIEIFNSLDFKNKIIQEMDLYNHYEIKQESSGSKFEMLKKYDKLIEVKRSKYNAVNISVLDRFPEKAAEIVNFIISELNTFERDIVAKRMSSYERALVASKDSLTDIYRFWKDSLSVLQEKGVLSRPEREGLFRAAGQIIGNAPDMKSVLDVNLKYGFVFDEVERDFIFYRGQIVEAEEILIHWQQQMSKDLEHVFIIERGEVPDKKHSPKRAVVVLIVLAISLSLVVSYLYFRENWATMINRVG